MDLVLLKRRKASVVSAVKRVLALFGVGDVGAFYLPGVGSLQNASGEIVESGASDPVGFQLDLSQGAWFSAGAFMGLGDEAYADPNFQSQAEWQAGDWVVAGGVATLVDPAASYALRASDNSPLTAGVWYAVRFTIDREDGLGVRFRDNDASVNYFPFGVGTHNLIVRASGVQSFQLRPNATAGGGTIVVSEFSVKPIPGNHAYQEVTSARPTLASSAGNVSLSFDGVDDWMEVGDLGYTIDENWAASWASSVGANGRFYWSYSSATQGSPRQLSNNMTWNDGASYSAIAPAASGSHVFTVQATDAATANLSGRADGVPGSTITRNGSLSAATLALGTADDSSFNSGPAMDFYGGFWISRTLSADELALPEGHLAERAGVTL